MASSQSPYPLHRGIDQGCPLSGILFQFYNDIDGYDPKKGKTVVTFVDNALMLACAKTLAAAKPKVTDMMTWPPDGLEGHTCTAVTLPWTSLV